MFSPSCGRTRTMIGASVPADIAHVAREFLEVRAPRRSRGRPRRSGCTRRRSSCRSFPSITISPMRDEGTSPSPEVSTWRWIPETSWSSRSWAMPRLRQARDRLLEFGPVERFAPPGSPLAPLLATTTSRNCTLSNVVKRPPQLSHWRRRRIEVLSSVGRSPLPASRRGRRMDSATRGVAACRA